MKNRLLFIDIVRIVGITLVVVQHVISTSSLGQSLQQFYFDINIFGLYHIYYGNIGVWLFIFASGCSLALNYGAIDMKARIKGFYAKRMLRIYPVYWAAVLYNLSMFSSIIPTLSLIDYVKVFSGFQAFFASTIDDFYGKVNGVFWFIGVLVSLYLLYPAISTMIKRRPHLSLLSLFLVSVASRIVIGQIPGLVRGYDWFPLCRVFEFGLGIYLVQTYLYPKAINTSRVVAFLSNSTFHVYLVHVPLLVLLQYNVVLFLLTTIVVSSMLYAFDNSLRQIVGTQFGNIVSRFGKPKQAG